MAESWDKFLLLLWKNYTQQKRRKTEKIFEIILPVLAFSFLVALRYLAAPIPSDSVHFKEFKPSIFSLPMSMTKNNSSITNLTISYSPNTPLIHNILCESMLYLIKELDGTKSFVSNPNKYTNCDILQNDPAFKIILNGYSNGVALENKLVNPLVNDSSFCGIQFDDSLAGIESMSEFPKDANIFVRFPAHLRNFPVATPFLNWNTNDMYPIILDSGPRSEEDNFGGEPSYMEEGFIPILHAIVKKIVDLKLAAENVSFKIPELRMKRFPYPEYLKDEFLQHVKIIFSLFLATSFYYPCQYNMIAIASEKENQLKEVMKVVGLTNRLHWTAWFTKIFVNNLVSIIIIVLIVKLFKFSSQFSTEKYDGYSLFTKTPWHVLFFFMVIYCITTICFCFMLSTLFSKASAATSFFGILWFVTLLPFMVYNNGSLKKKIFSCLAAQSAICFGFDIIFSFELINQGLQWSNFFTPIESDDSFCFGYVVIMLIFDAILYLLITLYVEQVFPGTYGIAKPWNFPLQKDFWRSCWKSSEVVEDKPMKKKNRVKRNTRDHSGPKVGVNIVDLTKVFGEKIAVNKLNLKIFKDQITVLLGHNGAGKTTTMSMLTGIFPPTSGTAKIAGHDIRTDLNGVRKSLGWCPQHNVLFPDLTVAEHIYFYSRIKGYTKEMVKDEVDKYIELLGLQDKRDVLSSSLSGGMQRRLSIGCAMCGGSRVVLLDEPSSGMDPFARRQLWDLLCTMKKGRTIILTTHFMDEADLLGDRVAILAEGTVRCVDTPFNLKKDLGIGYRLIAARKVSSDGSFIAPSDPITKLLKKHIPNVKLYTDTGSELSYVLPEEESGQFKSMLEDLEDNQDKLGLFGFGISAATLEDVFMKVGTDSSTVVSGNDQSDARNIDSTEKYEFPKSPPNSFTGSKLFFSQARALFYKRLIFAKRSWLLSTLQFAIPLINLLQLYLSSLMSQNLFELPAKNLALSHGYSDSVTYLSVTGTLNKEAELIKKAYGKYFEDSHISSMVFEETNKPMEGKYLEAAAMDISGVRKRNLVGVTIENEVMTAWFSNFALHDLPASYFLAYRAIIKAALSDFNLNIINRPLPFSPNLRGELVKLNVDLGNNLGIGMIFATAICLFFYIKEKVSRSKLLQYTSGVSPSVMWTMAFIWDMLIFFVISLALCIIIAIFQHDDFSSGRIFLLLIFFCFGSLPLHYVASLFFNTASMGFVFMFIFNLFTGIVFHFFMFIIDILGMDNIKNKLHNIFLLFPSYSLCNGVSNLKIVSNLLENCLSMCNTVNLTGSCHQSIFCSLQPQCCISDYPYFEWKVPGIGKNLLYLFGTGVVFFTILLVKEGITINSGGKTPPPIDPSEEDSDVAEERERIKSLDPSKYKMYNLIIDHMSKYYGSFLAVDQLTLGIQSGECFGLLGMNGAGKTTTFKMLTGDLGISSGDAWVKGFSVKNDKRSIYKKIGYCPQFDALLDEMTGNETLKMYSLLRGIPPNFQKVFTRDISEKLGFTQYLDKKVREYSGGNKRKLSTTLALLGHPDIIYLDEPTTGMDPISKRSVWKTLAGYKCIILTSHSMEECEALCSRLTIMVAGRPQCLGSPQHLKNKFSQGYTISIKLNRGRSQAISRRNSRNSVAIRHSTDGSHSNSSFEDYTISIKLNRDRSPSLNRRNSRNSVASRHSTDSSHSNSPFDFEPLHEFLTANFQGAKIVESYQGLVTYHLPDTKLYWSEIFGIMENAKKTLNIEYYSIRQTSLEQIFLQITKNEIVDV